MRYLTWQVQSWHVFRGTLVILAYAFLLMTLHGDQRNHLISLFDNEEYYALARVIAIDLLLLVIVCITYQFVSLLVDLALCVIFNLHRLGSIDIWLLLEVEGSPLNSGFLFEFKRSEFSYQKFKKWAKEKFFKKVPGAKFKLLSLMGHFFWQEMDSKEFDQKFDWLIIKKSSIHTQEKLIDFMNKKYFTHMDLFDNCPFRFYVIEDYDKETSYVFMVFQHSIIDGVSLISSLKLISDCTDMSTIPYIRGLSWDQLLHTYALYPFYAAKMTFFNLLRPHARNSLMDVSKQTKQEQNMLFLPNFDQEQFNESRKILKCTFGQAMCSILGQTLREYMEVHGDKDKHSIQLLQTVSVSPTPLHMDQMSHGCKMIGCLFDIGAEHDIKEGIQSTKQEFKRFMDEKDLAVCYLTVLALFSISWNAQYHLFFKQFFNFVDFGLTTVPGPTDGFVFNGMQTKSLRTILTPMNESHQQSGFSICTCNNKISITLTTFRDHLEQPQELMSIMDKKMRQFLQLSEKKQS